MARLFSYLTALTSAGSLIVLLVIAVLASGCASDPHVRFRTDADVSPMAAHAQRGRSLATVSGPADAGPRWYDARRDHGGPGVFAGYQTRTLSTVTTRRYSDVQVHDGRVREHSHDRTHRTSIQVTVK